MNLFIGYLVNAGDMDMNHLWHKYADTLIGGFTGFFGGMTTFVSFAWIDMRFIDSLWKAALTAVVCGAGGVGGRHLYLWASKLLKKKPKLKTDDGSNEIHP